MVKITPMRAIRAKCLDCCCGSSSEVRACTITDCPLYPLRYGHRESTMKKREAEKEKQISKQGN